MEIRTLFLICRGIEHKLFDLGMAPEAKLLDGFILQTLFLICKIDFFGRGLFEGGPIRGEGLFGVVGLFEDLWYSYIYTVCVFAPL